MSQPTPPGTTPPLSISRYHSALRTSLPKNIGRNTSSLTPAQNTYASTQMDQRATTTALKRLFENNSTTNKDTIKPFSDLKSTHFILPPLRVSHSSSFYHRSWCENRPFFPPCLATWPNHTKNPKNTPKQKIALPPSNLIDFIRA